MGPDTPLPPLCIWDAIGVSIFDHVRLKHTWPTFGPTLGMSWKRNVPEPVGLPFGTSWLPVICTVTVLRARAEAAITKLAATVNDVNTILRMVLLVLGVLACYARF